MGWWCACALLIPTFNHASIVRLGAGSYTTALPQGKQSLIVQNGSPAQPKVTADFNQHPTTNSWWSSLIWGYYSPYSQRMIAEPLTYRAVAGGLQVGFPTNIAVTPDIRTGNGWFAKEYHFNGDPDVLVGVEGLNAPDTRVASYGDWHVVADWSDSAGRGMRATMGHGFVYTYFHNVRGGNLVVRPIAPMNIWYRSADNSVIGFTINNTKHYALFAPAGAAWQGDNSGLRSNLGGKGYASIALLPRADQALVAQYAACAHARVTATEVTWNYDEAAGVLSTTFAATVQAQEGQANTLMAVYPHQRKALDDTSRGALQNISFRTGHGTMQVLQGTRFTMRQPFFGIVPVLPLVAEDGKDGFNRNTLYGHVDAIFRQSRQERWNNLVVQQSYWIGKAFGKIAQLALIADQVGHAQARDLFIREIKENLQDWLTASGGSDQNLFFYDTRWKAAIGFPESFDSNTLMNDHHFHWAYYIMAAAIVAQFDPAWAAQSQWGAMVDFIRRDASSGNPQDPLFPKFRNFDVYTGHSWANGPAMFDGGNNLESSSEAQNFNAATILWGVATNNKAVRDFGIMMYLQEAAAIRDYWFNVDGDVFPAAFDRPTLGMTWGDGGAYAIWWGDFLEAVYAINYLPVTAASLYLAAYPDYLRRRHEYMERGPGLGNVFRDIILAGRALYDPAGAVGVVNSNQPGPETGDSRARLYHWVHMVNALGQVVTNVTANSPTAMAFDKNGTRTYVAYNPTSERVTVRYSDGGSLEVPARSMATSRGTVQPNPNPNPDPNPNPNPNPNPDPQPQPCQTAWCPVVAQQADNSLLITATTNQAIDASAQVILALSRNGVVQAYHRMALQNGAWQARTAALAAGEVSYRILVAQQSGEFKYTVTGDAPNPNPNPNPNPEPSPIDVTKFGSGIATVNGQRVFYVTVPEGSRYAIIHYVVNSDVQQNIQMTGSQNNRLYTYPVPALRAGDRLRYFITYERGGPQYETAWVTVTA